MPLSEDRTANRTSRSWVSFHTFVPLQDVNPVEHVSKQRNKLFIQTFVEVSYKNAAIEPHYMFPSYAYRCRIRFPVLSYRYKYHPPNPVYVVRFCPKLRTMPHIKGNPGTTAGTVHHCPGRKISSYVKLGACRGKKEHGYCLTHQIPCLAPDCREKHWARLKNEPCTLCEQRRKVKLTEVKVLLYCAETKSLASRAVSSGRTPYRQRSQSPGSNRQQRAKKGGKAIDRCVSLMSSQPAPSGALIHFVQ